MKDDNIFLWVKAVIAAACGAFTAAFGWLGWLVVAWAACMVLDWLSGSAAAASRGEWSSAVARSGIWHKAGMLVVVIVAALTDAVLSIAVANLPGLGITYQSLILPVVLVWYIFTELGSIAENAAHMGADVPDGLLKLLAAGKKAAERHRRGRKQVHSPHAYRPGQRPVQDHRGQPGARHRCFCCAEKRHHQPRHSGFRHDLRSGLGLQQRPDEHGSVLQAERH